MAESIVPVVSTIRGRLLLWTVVGFVPAVVLATWVIIYSHQYQRQLVEQQLISTARSLAQVVDHRIGEAEALLRGVSSSSRLVTGEYEAFYQRAKQLLPGPGSWIVVQTPDGQEVVNTFVPWGTPLEKTNAPAESAPGLLSGQTHVSNLSYQGTQSQATVRVSVPVLQNGRLVVVLSVVILPGELNRLLVEQRLPAEWVAAIVDRSGTVLARSRNAERFIGKQATTDALDAMTRRQTTVFNSVTLDGQRSAASLGFVQEHGWTVVVAVSRALLYAPAQKLATHAGIIVTVLVAVSFILSTAMARRVARAVEILAASAQQLGKGGSLSHATTGLAEADHITVALHAAAEALSRREADLKRLNETLELRVAERTTELADANRALSVRNRELEDFAHIISHDMQAPVQRIGRFADLLDTEVSAELGETGRFYVQRMKVSATRISELIRDILSFSSITAEPRSRGPIDLEQVLGSVVSDLEARITQAGAQIQASPLHWVHGDHAQVYHILLNLISNSIKFRREGVPPVIQIETSQQGEYVHLTVEDNGIGFDDRQSERIFTPFYRAHVKESYEGTGIGLAIVRRIAERHGGSVRATSTPGQGSRFTVTLPAAAPGSAPVLKT